MDLKAIALLKLIYLEMFGHDMSWASFHVLEVMSSQKYPQKRVGYLAAVQSFRPDTEVLMLATNLLKKVRIVLRNRPEKAHNSTGHLVASCEYPQSSSCSSPPHHHTVTGDLPALRFTSKTFPFQPQCPEEDCRHTIPTSSCSPGNFEISLAKDQGDSDGRRREFQRHCCGGECRV